MGLMIKRTIPKALLLLAGTALYLLTSCEDISSFMTKLDDEVKLSNDRYLEVESVYPSQNSWFVNPGQDIQITFDRSVDPLRALEYIRISDSLGNTFALAGDDAEFDDNTNTLTLKPDPYLEDSRQYSIILETGLTGRENTPLRDEYSWSFTTGTYPKGYFIIHDDVAETGTRANYTNSATIPIEVITSNVSHYYISAVNPGVTDDSDRSGLLWHELSSAGGYDDLGSGGHGFTGLDGLNGLSFSLGSSPEGRRYVYMMFRDDGASVVNYSPLESRKTFLDLTDPVADAGVDAGPVRTGYSRSASASDPGFTAGTGSGIDANGYSWSAPGMTVTNANSQTATFTGPTSTDSEYSVTLTVSDLAGNHDTDSFKLDWDSEKPNAPDVAGTSPTIFDPYWTWTSRGPADATGSYRRSLNGGTWYTTTSESYSPRGLADGLHRLSVAEYDDAGNLSNSETHYIVKNSAQITPYNGQTGVSRTPTFDWPDSTLLSKTYGFVPYTMVKGNWVAGTPITGLTSSEYEVTLTLPADTELGWKHTVTSKAGTTYSPLYTFTTRN